MSHAIKFSGPFVKQFYANTSGSGSRTESNPAGATSYSSQIPSPLRRIYLLIQNKGETDVELLLSDEMGAASLKLSAGQSISFDNYNGPFMIGDYTNIAVFEAFA